MSRIVNPYNIVAFYAYRFDEAEDCPISSPTRRLPPFSLEFNASATSIEATLISLDSNSTYDISNRIEQRGTSDGKWYIRHKGTAHGFTPDNGDYRIELNLDDTIYYSHKLCLNDAYDEQTWGGIVQCASAGGGDYTFTFLMFGGVQVGMPVIEVDYGNGWVQENAAGQTSAAINQDDISGSGAIELDVRFRTILLDGEFYKVYKLDFNTSDPCGTDTWALQYEGGADMDRYAYLEFWNSTDLPNLGLLYGNQFVQRYYFEASHNFPVPVTEESFLRNQEGANVLQSSVVSEQVNIDTYPVPDYLLTVLQSLRYHDNIEFHGAMDGNEFTVENFNFASRNEDNDICSVGQIQFEVNRAYISGCEEDKTITYSG